MAVQNRVVLEVPSLPEHVSLARLLAAQVAAQLRFTVAEIEEIKVAVSEAVTNAMVHGYGGRGEGVVRIVVTVRQDEMEIEVTDQGCGMANLELARQPAFSTDPERMGLGFVFMENFMDALEVFTEPGRGTHVRMRKRSGTCGTVATGGQ